MIKFFFGTLGVAWLILKDCHSVCQRILKGKIHSSYFCLGKYIPPVDFYISFFFALILISYSNGVFRRSIHTYQIQLSI